MSKSVFAFQVSKGLKGLEIQAVQKMGGGLSSLIRRSLAHCDKYTILVRK